jgi:hypothetical protein
LIEKARIGRRSLADGTETSERSRQCPNPHPWHHLRADSVAFSWAGVITDVCVAFVSFSARALGCDLHAVLDASGTTNVIAREVTHLRLQEAGVALNSTVAVISELLGDWRTPHEGPASAQVPAPRSPGPQAELRLAPTRSRARSG